MTIDFRQLLKLMNSMVQNAKSKWKVSKHEERSFVISNDTYFITFTLFKNEEYGRLSLTDYGCPGRSLTLDNVSDQLFFTVIACVSELTNNLVKIDIDDSITVLQ